MLQSERLAAQHSGRGQNRWRYSPQQLACADITSLQHKSDGAIRFFAWLKYKGVPCLNSSCPPSWGHTTSWVRERQGGGRGKRAGSGHSDYGFQFWQLKATQGLLCTGTCSRGQNIQKAKALSVMLCKSALVQVWRLDSSAGRIIKKKKYCYYFNLNLY